MAMQHLWHKFITCFHKNHTNSNTIVSFKILEISKKKKENRKNLEISHLSSVSFSTTSYQNLSLSLSLSRAREIEKRVRFFPKWRSFILPSDFPSKSSLFAIAQQRLNVHIRKSSQTTAVSARSVIK